MGRIACPGRPGDGGGAGIAWQCSLGGGGGREGGGTAYHTSKCRAGDALCDMWWRAPAGPGLPPGGKGLDQREPGAPVIDTVAVCKATGPAPISKGTPPPL